jgi:hypothetical protein
MKTFIRNNLAFRVVSSNAIAKFKAGQAFDFNELSRKATDFSVSSKESLLLEYEYWFRWLLRSEKIFLLLRHDETPAALDGQLCTSIGIEFEDIEELMACHGDIFDVETRQFIKFIHTVIEQAFEKILKKILLSDDIYSAFSKITGFVSNYLQFVLFSLYEFEAVRDNEECFFSYNTFCNEVSEASMICLLALKVAYFKEKFNITTCVIKNYTSGDVRPEHLKALEEHGVTVSRIEHVAENT